MIKLMTEEGIALINSDFITRVHIHEESKYVYIYMADGDSLGGDLTKKLKKQLKGLIS